MKNIFMFLAIIFFENSTACQNRFDDYNRYENYKKTAILTIPEMICHYYRKNSNTPESKTDFENFLSKEENDFGLGKVLSPLNYKFIKDEDSDELIMYDLGMDNVDDSLKIKYTLEDMSVNTYRKGDVFIISTRLEQCKINIRDEKKLLYIYSKGEIRYDENREISREINRIIMKYVVNSVIGDSVNLDNYFPKVGEVRKLSVLHAKLKNDKWITNLLHENHSKTELESLIPLIINWLEESNSIKTQSIDELYIPILYYDRNQLKILK